MSMILYKDVLLKNENKFCKVSTLSKKDNKEIIVRVKQPKSKECFILITKMLYSNGWSSLKGKKKKCKRIEMVLNNQDLRRGKKVGGKKKDGCGIIA